MTASPRPLILLAASCAVLGGLVAKAAVDLGRLPEVPGLALTPPPGNQQVFALPEPAPLDAYRALLDRPLFGGAADVAAVEDIEPAPIDRPALRPVAIVTAPDRKMVLLQGDETGPLVRATLGDEIDGRRILEITAKELVLEGRDGAIEVLRLRPPDADGDGATPLIETATARGGDRRESSPSLDLQPAPPVGLNRDLPVWTPEALGQLISTLPDSGQAR
jgi:hypothetical protein